jgi:lipid A ethanolaminephosphotransferase
MIRYLKTPEALIIAVSCWMALISNTGFWAVIAGEMPAGLLLSTPYFAAFLSLTVGLISLVLLLLAFGRPAPILLGVALIIAASANYYTARYGVLFDSGMMTNIVETNTAEAFELMSLPFMGVIAIAGLLPALAIWAYPIKPRRVRTAILHRGTALLVAMILIVTPLLTSQKEIFSVARNHQELRHMIAPLNVISASYVSVRDRLETPAEHRPVALDAAHATAAAQHRKPMVHVLIVGETARAANFSLNGYALNTNRELEQEKDAQFLTMQSCGTATAVSLPCMFSIQEHDNFDRELSKNEDNLLDVAARSGYEVLWIDNGNGCKGICAHVASRDVHLSDVENMCPDGACYDEILVHELENILDTVSSDTLIVLHQLGSHGPAYFRRYPEAFRLFQPDCQSPNFGDCSRAEIANSYDNTIAYTDHVIAGAIATLSARGDDFDTSLIYVSDHGESLGERGIYLHGMPYKLAPAEQTTVPLILWLGAHEESRVATKAPCVEDESRPPLSHDNLFHTELGLLGIRTEAYKPDLDILLSCHSKLPV